MAAKRSDDHGGEQCGEESAQENVVTQPEDKIELVGIPCSDEERESYGKLNAICCIWIIMKSHIFQALPIL